MEVEISISHWENSACDTGKKYIDDPFLEENYYILFSGLDYSVHITFNTV